LRGHFEAMGLTEVETFIASGNVVFTSGARRTDKLEHKIACGLEQSLGYPVPTFIRTIPELVAIAAYQPWSPDELAHAVALNVGLFTAPLDADTIRRVIELRTEIDEFHVHGRELYWLCRTRQSESLVSNTLLQKALGRQSTFRNLNTIQRMAAKYAVNQEARK